MAKENEHRIKDLYQGGYSTLDPEKEGNFTGYRMSAADIGITTDGRTANVLKTLSESISRGTKTVEVGSISPEVFESIPNQQLKEVNRLSKLTGVDISVHVPVVEPSGITQQGFTESSRKAVERQMNQFVERAHEMGPNGNIPVTFHSSAGLPGTTPEKGKEPEETIFVNRETGSFGKVPLKKREFPGEKEPSIENEIAKQNEESWLHSLRNISYYANMGDRSIQQTGYVGARLKGEEITPEQKAVKSEFESGVTFLNSSYRDLRDLFETAYKHGTDAERDKLNEFKKRVEEKAILISKDPESPEGIFSTKEIIDDGVETLRKLRPQLIEPLNDFAKDKTTETFANVALNAYDKFKDKAPVISIENPPAGGAFSTGEELRKIVEDTREKFIEKATEPRKDSKGNFIPALSRSQARKQAEKLIGVTWDVGHINMMRKQGYESKDIIKETEKVAKLVKHVHLSDNFGFEHTELPMGMGNVPIKEMMGKLGDEGYEGKKIVEAISWIQHFGAPPVKESLEAFGSPIYSMNMQPYWNQSAGFQQDYSSGYGLMLPQVNFETFGAGFSQLPMELGGQRAGAQGSRVSGRGME